MPVKGGSVKNLIFTLFSNQTTSVAVDYIKHNNLITLFLENIVFEK
jgi:hypothetical protein